MPVAGGLLCPTLREALNQVFGPSAATSLPGQPPPADDWGPTSPSAVAPGSGVSPDLRRAAAQVSNALNRLRTAQAAGDFAGQGQALAELETAVQGFLAASPTGQPAIPATSNGHG